MVKKTHWPKHKDVGEDWYFTAYWRTVGIIKVLGTHKDGKFILLRPVLGYHKHSSLTVGMHLFRTFGAAQESVEERRRELVEHLKSQAEHMRVKTFDDYAVLDHQAYVKTNTEETNESNESNR